MLLTVYFFHVVLQWPSGYNPHVRYAAAMALGIACAGTALLEATHLIQPVTL